MWCGLVWCGVVWCGLVWCGAWCIHTHKHAYVGGHALDIGGHAVDMAGDGADMRWTLVDMGWTCGGHWWTCDKPPLDQPTLLLRCHRRGADAVHFASVTCPRCVHIVSMSDDSQITVGAQSELSQSYSQSSVRAGVFPRKFVFLQKSLLPLLLKRLGGSPHFHI